MACSSSRDLGRLGRSVSRAFLLGARLPHAARLSGMPRRNALVEHLRRAGSVRSAKKTRAARENAKLGGKPPKFQAGDPVTVRTVDAAPAKRRGLAGVIIGPAKSRAHYLVRFADGDVALPSWWLERATRSAAERREYFTQPAEHIVKVPPGQADG